VLRTEWKNRLGLSRRSRLIFSVLGQMGGRSSVVEFQPSKLAVVGSNPIARSKKKNMVLGRSPQPFMVKAGIR
jgi:hypothetical protein